MPGAIPVTTPVALTVATAVFDEAQGLVAAGVPEPVRVMVAPSQRVVGPVMVGRAVTVMVVVAEHPLLLV